MNQRLNHSAEASCRVLAIAQNESQRQGLASVQIKNRPTDRLSHLAEGGRVKLLRM